MILATDGDLNVGITSEGALTRLIQKKAGKRGAFIGSRRREQAISRIIRWKLADNGNGNYNYLDSIYEAKKVLGGRDGRNSDCGGKGCENPGGI